MNLQLSLDQKFGPYPKKKTWPNEREIAEEVYRLNQDATRAIVSFWEADQPAVVASFYLSKISEYYLRIIYLMDELGKQSKNKLENIPGIDCPTKDGLQLVRTK